MPLVQFAETLLTDLARRNPNERVRRAVEVARGAAGEERRALLADLGAREPYYRHLAVTMAAATRESGHLLAALDDPYPSVRRHALCTPDLPDDAVAERLADASWTDRLAIYARLRRERRTALADRLLAVVRQRWGDDEAARFLAACSGPVVAQALAGLGYALRNWASLTLRHPEPVIAYAEAELAALDIEARVDWWGHSGAILRALQLHQPAAVLDLCERFLTGAVPPAVWHSLPRLLGVDPARVARLLLADPSRPGQLATQQLSRSVRERLATLPDGDLGVLLRASGPAPGLVASVLGSLPASRRETIFNVVYAGRELAAQVLPEEILTVLPHQRRHSEARRMLALPAVAADTALRLRTTALLPYDEAVAVLDEASRSAEAQERAYAYELLVRCAARTGDPAVVTDLLAGLNRIRNEQDPVRSRLLSALAQVRPDLFGMGTVGALDGLVRDALDARDCSWQTTNAVLHLVFRVLWWSATAGGAGNSPIAGGAGNSPIAGGAGNSPTAGQTRPLMLWALETIERVGGWQRSLLTADLSRLLRRGQEHAVFEHIRPWLTQALRRNDAGPLLAFARSLGRRAWHMPALQELIGQATRVKDDSVVSSAVSLWLAPPWGRAEKVDVLVTRDKSALTLGVVLAVVARRRTRLIDEDLLAGRPLKGRFGTGKAVWVPAVGRSALALWLPDQVERYAALVRRGIQDAGLDRSRRAALARTLAGLPGSATVAELIAGDDVLIAEAALTGLAHCDRPDAALPVLLDNVQGERARVAVFAASRCARYVPPSRLAAILREALAGAAKVTVRKEAARLLSAMRVPGAVDELVAAWHRDGQHRDVLVAVAVAVRAWLDDPRSWTILEAAVEGERHAAESLLDAVAHRLAERHRERYAALVRRLTRHPEPEVARRAYEALPSWAPWAPGIAAEITAGVTDMAAGRTWRYAASCALSPAVWSAMPDLLPRLTAELLRLTRSDPDAEPLRDLPARQRLGYLVRGLAGEPSAGDTARRHPAPVRRMVELLGAEPTFVVDAARLSASLLWPGPDFVADLVALADLLAPLPCACSEVVGYHFAAQWEPSEVAPGVDALAGRGDPAGGLLAVSLTAVAGKRAGWPDAWRERLRALRRHESPQVRQVALAVFTATESAGYGEVRRRIGMSAHRWLPFPPAW